MYVSDNGNSEIRVIDLATNAVTTLAGSTTPGTRDGVGSAASFKQPGSIVIDSTDSTLYVADNHNSAIRKIDIATGEVHSRTAFKEPGKYGTTDYASLDGIGGLALDSVNNLLYLSSTNGGTIRKLDLTNLTSAILAGNDQDTGFANGPGASALLDFPEGLLLTESGLLVADSSNHQIRKVDLSTDVVSTFAGSAQPASFSGPHGVTAVGDFLYITESRGGVIRRVSMVSGNATTLTNSNGNPVSFVEPCGITTDGTHLFVVDGNRNEVSQITIATGEATVLAGSPTNAGAADGYGMTATLNAPQGIAIDPEHKSLYIADQCNNLIRKIVIATGQVTTLAGSTESGVADGVGTAARFNMPADLVVDAKGTALYVSDGENNTIRKIDLGTTQVTTLAGNPASGTTYKDGVGAAALFSKPWGIVTDGTYVYFAGAGDDMIRRLELSTNEVVTISGRYEAGHTDGSGINATFNRPEGIAIDAAGSFLYVCDYSNNLVRRVRLK